MIPADPLPPETVAVLDEVRALNDAAEVALLNAHLAVKRRLARGEPTGDIVAVLRARVRDLDAWSAELTRGPR